MVKIVSFCCVLFNILLLCCCQIPISLITAEMPELTQKEDGVYRGSDDLKSVILDVTIGNHHIIKINIIEHYYLLGKNAEKIVDQIIKHQSLNVDVVTGATFSSKRILQAVGNALK